MKSTDRLNQINRPNSQTPSKLPSDPATGPGQFLAPMPQRHRLLRLKEVMFATGVARTYIYSEIKQGRFPAPIKAGSASLWVEAEIQAWIQQRIASRQLQ